VSGRLLAVVAALAGTAAFASAAHAAPATLWGCHGPAGQPLGAAPFVATTSGDGAAETFAAGCGAAAGALDDGGLRAAFTRADPLAGSVASWQAPLPEGVTVSRVALARRTRGFGGTPVPGGAQRYVAETAGGALEAASVEDATNAPLDGTADLAAAGGRYLRFGLSCAAAAPQRCAAPSTTPLAVEVGAVTVRVDDAQAPRGAVGGLASPASGTLALTVRASDAGLGLARAEASLDGVVAASATLGGAACADLSPGDPAVDLPLGDGCPASVTDLALPVPTPAYGDGVHRLQVTVTDAAGHRAVLADQGIVINNSPPERHSTAVLTLGTGDPAGGGGSGGGAVVAGSGFAVAGAGSAGGRVPVCRAPRLSMFLKDKPLRVAHGVPVLRRDARYRFAGTLTCAVGGRRVHAPSGVTVALRNRIGSRTYKKGGVVTRSDGGLTIILAYRSARLLDFSYTSIDGTTTRVRIRIAVGRAR
jgi:hypothetical protein